MRPEFEAEVGTNPLVWQAYPAESHNPGLTPAVAGPPGRGRSPARGGRGYPPARDPAPSQDRLNAPAVPDRAISVPPRRTKAPAPSEAPAVSATDTRASGSVKTAN